MKLYELSDEPERKAFLDKLIQFQEERGTPISQCPTISKLPLDLYKLYVEVKQRGGFLEVTRNKLWKECTQVCNIATSSSAAYTLRKQYIKHLLPFECKFDRGGIDHMPIIASLENSNRKKGKATPPTNDSPFPAPPSSASMDGYPQYPHPQGYPGPPTTGMPNSEYQAHQQPPPPSSFPQQGSMMSGPPPPHHHSAQGLPASAPPPSQTPSSMSNHSISDGASDSVSVQDPFADDMQTNVNCAPRGAHPVPNSGAPSSLPGSQPSDYNNFNNYNVSGSGHNSYYNSGPVANQSGPPPSHDQFGPGGEGYNSENYSGIQSGPTTPHSDPYNSSAPPSSTSGYSSTRMPPYYNQHQQQPPPPSQPQGYEQQHHSSQPPHMTDNQRPFDQRPPSRDNANLYQQQQQHQQQQQQQQPGPPVPQRAQYGAPPSQSSPAQPNQSAGNYPRGPQMGQYGAIGHNQWPYGGSANQEPYSRGNEMSNYQVI